MKQGEKISNLENALQNLIHLPLTICKRTLKRSEPSSGADRESGTGENGQPDGEIAGEESGTGPVSYTHLVHFPSAVWYYDRFYQRDSYRNKDSPGRRITGTGCHQWVL